MRRSRRRLLGALHRAQRGDGAVRRGHCFWQKNPAIDHITAGLEPQAAPDRTVGCQFQRLNGERRRHAVEGHGNVSRPATSRGRSATQVGLRFAQKKPVGHPRGKSPSGGACRDVNRRIQSARLGAVRRAGRSRAVSVGALTRGGGQNRRGAQPLRSGARLGRAAFSRRLETERDHPGAWPGGIRQRDFHRRPSRARRAKPKRHRRARDVLRARAFYVRGKPPLGQVVRRGHRVAARVGRRQAKRPVADVRRVCRAFGVHRLGSRRGVGQCHSAVATAAVQSPALQRRGAWPTAR